MNKAITYLFENCFKIANARLFKNLIYVFIILKCCIWSLNFDILFGQKSIALIAETQQNFYKKFAFLLYNSDATILALMFLLLLFVFTIIALVKKRNYPLIDFCLFLIMSNINLRLYTSLTAGDPLLVNLLFFNIFLRKQETCTKGIVAEITNMLHNFSYAGLLVQVCIVYGYSAFIKLFDSDWQNGDAIHLVNNTYHYSRAFLVDNADLLYPISFVLNYLILAYQLLFPFFVWLKPVKKAVLIFGLIMHVYIALVMGLFFFGLIMAITYVLFYNFEKARIKN